MGWKIFWVKKEMQFFDIGYGQLDFRMYSQAAQAHTAPCLLEYHWGKVCGKIFGWRVAIYKICELKKYLILKKR